MCHSCKKNFIFLNAQNSGDSNTYMIHTRVPSGLPITDIDINSPRGDETLMLSMGEVCYA